MKGFSFAVAILAFTISIPCHSSAQVSRDSFLDLNNDGIFTEGDVYLSRFPSDGSLHFDYKKTYPGLYRPQSGPVGLVLRGTNSFPTLKSQSSISVGFIVDGDIHISGTFLAKGKDDFGRVSFSTSKNIFVAPKTKLKLNTDLFLAAGSALIIGERSQLEVSQNGASLLAADIVVDEGTKMRLTNSYYDQFNVTATRTLTVKKGFQYGAPHHARTYFVAPWGTFDNAKITSGSLTIEVPNLLSPTQKITISNSVIKQSYRNGTLNLKGVELINTLVTFKHPH